MITTGKELRKAREELGWSPYDLGCALQLQGEQSTVRKRVMDMERGAIPISGPIAVAVASFLAGFVPEGFTTE